MVVMAGRNAERLESAAEDVRESSKSSDVHTLLFDLASLQSVREAAQTFLRDYRELHVLINNAGLFLSEHRISRDNYEATFATNHLGHFLLTGLLYEPLRNAGTARVIHVSSDAHRSSRGIDFHDIHYLRRRYSGIRAYADSKLANVLFSNELARRWISDGITSNSLHPGVVSTGFAADGDATGIQRLIWDLMRPFMTSPRKGAQTSIHLATSPEVSGVTGAYFVRKRAVQPSLLAVQEAVAKKLWAVSEEMIG